MKSVLFLYNPLSGEAQIVARLDKIVACFQEAGVRLTLFRISRREGFNRLDETIRSLQPDYLLVAGGDGTIHRLVNYLQARSIDLPLAILPAGTANDFARLIGMPLQMQAACRAILSGRIERIDLGEVNGRYFVNVLSSGLFTEISQKTPTKLKNTLGRAAYYISGLGEIPLFRRLEIRVESEACSFEGSCLLFLVFNGQTAGNLPLAGHANAQDGLLDVLIIRGENLMESLQAVVKLVMSRKTDYPEDIICFKTDRLKISLSRPASTDLDGERGPDFPLEITARPAALQVIVPAGKSPQE